MDNGVSLVKDWVLGVPDGGSRSYEMPVEERSRYGQLCMRARIKGVCIRLGFEDMRISIPRCPSGLYEVVTLTRTAKDA